MSSSSESVIIETDLFIFEAPEGWVIDTLDEQAELTGPNDEFLVVSSYTIDHDSSADMLTEFAKNISSAMVAAANEPDLVITDKLKKELTPNDLPVWRVLSKARDESQFFDQYAVIHNSTAVVVTIDGDLANRASSALIEEAVYSVEFKEIDD